MKTKRFLAWVIAMVMLVSLFPGFGITAAAEEPTIEQSSTRENQNQASGIIYTKTSTAKSDGTIDITLTAHTTGVVRQMTSVSPTDIVLVLDVSGSMDENYTTTRITGYNAATGSQYTYTEWVFIIPVQRTAYGMENTGRNYYINTGTAQEPVYTRVTYTGRDDNGFEMYEYSAGNTEVIVYPALSGNITATREHTSYNVVQFYSATTESQTVGKMTSLQNAVNAFIDTTEQMNEGLEEDQMHTVSIVKFADNSYYNSSVPTIVEGNNKGADGRADYNYSQVVKNLTPVDAAGAAALKAAVNSLDPGGATAVDYGLNLAEAVLMNRSQVLDESAVDRNEVIVVFTDGEPNHSSDFSTSVANTAIGTAGDMKRDADVTVYGVCIATNADASDTSANINKFMHYISSNYPNATSMTAPGTGGSIDKGYYMTPDGTTSLMMIFESIIQNIDHPTVTLGEEATMVDTISPYFDFVGTASNVKLQTSLRNADGTWATPVNDNTLSCDIISDRLIVNGFDFDENFISSTGRGTNGDFYGKQLVISFTVTPDYDVIDAASATLMDGILPTNSGFASLVDSDSTPAAEVATPELVTHQVTYTVGGEEYAVYNRFTGSDITVDAEPQKEGHTFSGWYLDGEPVDPDDTFTMPDEDVVITGTFTANKYNVRYAYSGVIPDDATDLSGATYNGNAVNNDVAYGSTVTVAPNATAPGYIFSGWRLLDQSVTVSNGSFTMPDHPVTLIGTFTPADNTRYQVIHYLETMEDGVYTEHETENHTDSTGATAVAVPKYFPGFTLDEANVNRVTSGTVTVDPMLVLKLYYNRNSYKVTYSYTGDVPENPPALPMEKNYKYGESVTVADDVSVEGYTFGGWKSQTTNVGAGHTFTMPAHNVAFVGEFTANADTQYKVEYYLQNIENNDYTLDTASSYTNTATTGSTVYANHKEFEGFDFDAANANNKLSGEVAGDGSLVLKLYYNRKIHKVTYAYEGTQQPGAPSVPTDSKDYRFGETVTVKADLELEGYTFAGWHSTGYTVNNDTVSFTMPARNVTLYGSFEPASGVVWKEEHYFEDLEGGTYTLKYTFDHTGTTGDTVTAQPIAEEPGFEFDDTAANVTSAEIDGSGTTTLKFHYKRLSYEVSYVYDPAAQPTGAPDLSVAPYAPVSYKFGQEVTVAAKASLTGYDFIGWYPEQSGVPVSGTFTMPAHTVVFEGDFNPRSDTHYEVHHHLQNADGTYPSDPNFINGHTGVTGEEVTAQPRYFAGYTLRSTAPVTGVVKGDGTLVLDLFYDRIEYNVTYYLTGLIPDGVTAPEDLQSPYRHGAEVTVKPPMSATGLVFTGWNPVAQSSEEATVTIADGKFTMPMHNVRLVGHFSAATNIPYKIRHWTQKADLDEYEIYLEDERVGTTGDEVTVYALVIPGFANVTTVGSAVVPTQTATIAGDGSLIINFYYDRHTHKVTYEYEGMTPDGTPALPSEETNVRFGKEITVAAAPAVPGYTFSGWATTDATISEGKFNMPDKDVVLKGSFTSNEVDYTVNYWFQKVDAGTTFDPADYEHDASSYTRTAFVGQHVEADAINHTGFSVNAHSNTYGHVTVDASGTGNLILNIYYDRHTYNVTYGYYGEQPENAPDLTGKNMTNVRYGTEVDVEEKPELAGYAFDGWYTRTATVADNKFTMSDHDVAFLGRFVQQFNVSYDLNGGIGADGVDYSTQTVNAGAEITVKAAPSINGYTFAGWKAGEASFNPDDTVTVDKNITFVAQWLTNSRPGGGSGGTKYTLTYETNGGNNIPKETHTSGRNVKLTKVPEKDGYVFNGWHLDEELTEDVTEVKMTKNITVYADWVEDNGNAGNGHSTPGSLNGDDHFAYVVGYPDGTVRPEDNIDRAEVTAIFFRLLKDEVRERNLTTSNSFGDVNDGDWHNQAISTMTKLGIVNGRYADRFVPDAFITRAEFATICARFDDSEFEVVDEFTDVSGHWAEAEIHEAAAHGWIRGYEDSTFKPDQFITRAEAMTMINRVLNRIPENTGDLLDDMIKWPDNSDTSIWYYIAVQEATNSHEYTMKNNVYEKWTALSAVTDWTKY